MAPRNWTNGGGTPLSAANLNALEAELAAKAEKTLATAAADGLMPKADKARLDAATASATPGTIPIRSATSGNFLVGEPTALGHATTKSYVDDALTGKASTAVATAAADGLMPKADKAKLDAATAATSNNTVVMRDANGNTGFDRVFITDPPTAADHGTRKDYVDAADALKIDKTASLITDWNTATANGFYYSVSGGANMIPVAGNQLGYAVATATAVTQWGWAYQSDSETDTKTFRRDLNGSTWSAWARVRETEVEMDARYAQLASATDINYYVSTTGSNSNDGLSAGTPFLTVQKAVDVAVTKSLGIDKAVVINMAAGTYAGRVVFPSFTERRLNITIQGPEVAHPGVPTVIQTEGATVSAVAFFSKNPNNTIRVRNIKFVGYRNSTASSGITVANGGYLFTENVHCTDCYWGISGQTAQIDVSGGIFDRCGFLGTSGSGSGAGIRSLQLNQHAIGDQSAGNLNSGPIFRNSIAAVFAQELSTGHVDWCTIEDCTFGLNLAVNARVNSDGTSFKRNAVDIRATSGANVYLTANNAFGTGADESAVKMLLSNGATVNDDYRLFTNILQSNGGLYRSADTVFPNATVTAQTTQVVYTATLGAGLWRQDTSALGLGRKLNVKIYGTLTGSLGVKDVTVRLGTAIASTQFTAAEASGSFEAEATIFFTGKATQLLSMRAYKHLSASMRVSSASGTNAMTANTNLTVEARAGTAGDSVLISAIELNWA